MRLFAAFLFVLVAVPVGAQERRVFKSSDYERGSSTQPARPVLRPFDDSDPEMQEFAEAYMQLGPCNRGPGKSCPEAALPLRAGGDRLASYLITQYEASVAEGYGDTLTYLAAAAATRSHTGFEYVRQLIRAPRSQKEYMFALRVLRRCGREEAIDEALRLLRELPPDDHEARSRAIRALGWNLEATGVERPDAIATLQQLRDSGEVYGAYAARRALEKIGAE